MSLDPKKTLSEFVACLGLQPGEIVLCAVSGGADSLCLLLLLQELGTKVTALHCNHSLRGAASELDQRLIEKICMKHAIPLKVFKTKIGHASGLELRSRRWRRRCYARAAEVLGARFVFLAHHQRDQAETLLLNLARGAGLQGALAMQPLAALEESEARLARPFLQVSPESLRTLLRRRKVSWREDASNDDSRFARNVIRHKVLPLLEGLVPGATGHLAAFTRRVKSQGLPGLDDRGLQRVKALLEKGRGSADLGGGMALQASAGKLRLKPVVTIKQCFIPKDWKPEANVFWFSDVKLGKALKIRGAQAGDRFQPFGMKGSRLVFDVLAEHKVPAWKREGWPLLVAGKNEGILGVLGVRQAEGYRVGPTTKQALRVSWGSFDK